MKENCHGNSSRVLETSNQISEMAKHFLQMPQGMVVPETIKKLNVDTLRCITTEHKLVTK